MVPPISVREILDVYEYRKLLECFTAERAALTAKDAHVAVLQEAVDAERKPGAAEENLLAVNHRIHLGLAEIAGNRRVLDQLRRTLEYVDRLDILSLEKDAHPVFHDEIVRAVRTHNPRAARQAMAEHIDSARDRMVKLFGS